MVTGGGTIIGLILQLRKLRFREVMLIVWVSQEEKQCPSLDKQGW